MKKSPISVWTILEQMEKGVFPTWLSANDGMHLDIIYVYVIVKKENIPHNDWKLDRVLAVQDNDGLIRKVTIQIGEWKLGKKGDRHIKLSIVERPVQLVNFGHEEQQNTNYQVGSGFTYLLKQR